MNDLHSTELVKDAHHRLQFLHHARGVLVSELLSKHSLRVGFGETFAQRIRKSLLTTLLWALRLGALVRMVLFVVLLAFLVVAERLSEGFNTEISRN